MSTATDENITEESLANSAHEDSQNRLNPTPPTQSTSVGDSSVTERPKTFKRPHASYQKSNPSPEIINAEKQMNNKKMNMITLHT
ncbi:unnamed protein product [Parnassius apollo]|uniref:(apollo) hypothetical protein n=1 Tax=Parnassius apollo TaxID=110799 RepID=A0A8S3XP43_PARAO|nr:unnamed protein product [Parnassius apollo]